MKSAKMNRKEFATEDSVTEKIRTLYTLIDNGDLKPLKEYIKQVQDELFEEIASDERIFDIGLGPTSLLGFSAARGRVDILKLLISAGFDAVYNDVVFANHPIHLACQTGNLEVVRFLALRHEISINSLNEDGFSTLCIATRNNFLNVVKFLVSVGAEVNYVSKMYPCHSALHLAATTTTEMCQFLISVGAKLDREDSEGNTPLCLAVSKKDADIAKVFVDHGTDINHRNMYYLTPLAIAFNDKNAKMLKVLCSRDPECVDDNGNSPLHHAVIRSMYDFTRYLVVDIGVSLDLENEEGDTPFTLAMSKGNKEIAQLLLNSGLFVENARYVVDEDVVDGMLNADGGVEFLEYVRYVTSNSRSLVELCCFKIRELIGKGVARHVDSLPLPRFLKNAVLLKHV